ncbi:MAG: NADP-dependent malic enzyme [Bacteroidales bacterium]|nr:NADP-dependent malic enzyme [Bacteroidales bacterium]MBN2755943.1 NADP-dependent malic enzyme [Bacteroidales bacterium]
MAKISKEDALNYHSVGRPGKIEVVPTKPYSTQRDLALAYSPGVADPCLEIEKNPSDVYKYTAKGNLVAVISNGTAVLGLGNLGAMAGKPVMEGKGLLFKIFADIDVFDIEIDTTDIDKFVETVKEISPTFGGINLEDIKAPECFEIERRLKEALDIPVMHDDQHGTAIISAAGIVNSLELVNKKFKDIKVVVSGAGASAMACTNLLISLGVNKENVVMCDSKGPITDKRSDINKYKKDFTTTRNLNSLEEAMVDADVFLGLSTKDVVSKAMVKSMADNPIVFAMANPDPEISYEDAMDARTDIIMATGRSDYPNQVNNVLGFPFIFRGALDVRATAINEEMKKAAVYAIASLAKMDVPEAVNAAYNAKNLKFGREYIIPKPLDPRLITTVAPAVAKAAMDSGAALNPITDWDAYKTTLAERLGLGNKIIRSINEKAKQNPKSVVFAEATNFKVLKAAQVVLNEGLAKPILLGNVETIKELIKDNQLDLETVTIIDPRSKEETERRKRFANILWEKRKRKGLTLDEAEELMFNRNYFGIMLVETGEADAFVSGTSSKYSEIVRPALQIVGTHPKYNHIAGMHIVMSKQGPLFFADTTVNMQPDAETIIETTLLTESTVKKYGIDPVMAMISYSNFGSTKGGSPSTVQQAIKIIHKSHPDIMVDGEMQANFALNQKNREKKFPFSKLKGKKVNTLIFPNLSSGNAAYKLMQELGGGEVIGPVLMGMNKSIQVLQIESSVREIVYMATIAVIDAQCIEEETCM